MKKIMTDKICLVTGANAGIGYALCIALAEYGAKVIMVCRDRFRGEKARKEIIEKTQNINVELLLIDLSSQKSIRNGVSEFKKKYKTLDVLINNAGILLFRETLTEDNIEATLAINYLGPFLLTNLLLDILLASAPSRIINVVSEGVSKGEFDLENLFTYKKFNPIKIYSRTKQAEILFSHELAARLKQTKVTSNCYYPGLVKTNLGKAEKGFRKFTFHVITGLLKFLFTPMEKSIKPGIFLAVSKKAEKLTGKFLKRKKDKIEVDGTYNKELSKKLWEMSEKLTGLKNNYTS